MNILKGMLGGGQTGELLAVLTKSGFSAKEAERFLPVASESIAQAASDLDLSSGDASDLVTTLSQKIDIQEIASKLGMDSDAVSNGLAALLPHALKLLQGGGLTSLLKGAGLRGLLGGLGGRN